MWEWQGLGKFSILTTLICQIINLSQFQISK